MVPDGLPRPSSVSLVYPPKSEAGREPLPKVSDPSPPRASSGMARDQSFSNSTKAKSVLLGKRNHDASRHKNRQDFYRRPDGTCLRGWYARRLPARTSRDSMVLGLEPSSRPAYRNHPSFDQPRLTLVLSVLRTFAIRMPVGILVAPGFGPACLPKGRRYICKPFETHYTRPGFSPA